MVSRRGVRQTQHLDQRNGWTMTTTSCLCGAISYEINGKITQPRYCHCSHCRKFSGSAYAAWGVVEVDSFRWISGAELVSRFDAGNGHRTFCSQCGSPVRYEPHATNKILGIPLGALHDAPPPTMHLWTRSKLPWIEINDDLAQYETYPRT